MPEKIVAASTSSSNRPDQLLGGRQEAFVRFEEAEQLRMSGKLDRAQHVCEALLRQYPDYMAALHTLGLIHVERKNFQLALNSLVRAAMLSPRSWPTLTALSAVYLELGASELAAQTLESARAIKAKDPDILVMLGEIYRRKCEYERAKAAFGQALEVEPHLERAAFGYGCICLNLGHDDEAVATFEKMVKQGSTSFEILGGLIEARSSSITVDLFAQIEKLIGKGEQDAGRILPYIRAAALDRAGRYAEAWEQLVPANKAVFATMQDDLRASLQRQQLALSALRDNEIRPATSDREKPISLFILGPSRSGKTTMEALVGTLPNVKRGYENRVVDIAIKTTFQAAGHPPSELFEMLPPKLYPRCRETYLGEITSHTDSAKVFTSTNPDRIFDAAFIATVFPNVRFVLMKRNLEDTLLRIYQKRYVAGNSYAYDLKAAREHLRWYDEMIDLLAQKAPDLVRVVRYEDMISDPSAALRTAAEICQLPLPDRSPPRLGDDRGCASNYVELMRSSA